MNTMSFEDFYNRLVTIENSSNPNSWVNEEYIDEVVEIRMKKMKEETVRKARAKSITREQDLRRKLLYMLGKYELEDGEVLID